MQIDVVTAFPGLVEGPLGFSIVRRAREAGLVEVRVHDLRDYTDDRHKKVDDTPYGGGGGMVLMPGPLFAAVEAIRGTTAAAGTRTILFCPQGRRYDQETAHRLSGYGRLILLCGRYEGVDERVREHLADESISIGDYVLTGGEIPALVLIDSITRLLPGALGDAEAARHDTFSEGMFDFPQYTRPADFRGHKVPEVLLSGDHARIEAWRRERALEKTARERPDLLTGRVRGTTSTHEH
ncbi:MAG TPA: tRNA (guanosine(37)-N1)-methyltransferase TrmD [Candidatus Polarisedimenticolia bacterium]|nr:tRNA (guanosine(37)-N1)-methyltransferase TrmD [Candidatus Polarisedimenticolia bacterium]